MREVYKAVRILTRQGVRLRGSDELSERLSAQCGLSATACQLSLLALADMKLIEMRRKPYAVQLLPATKTDPATSALWRDIQSLRGGGVVS